MMTPTGLRPANMADLVKQHQAGVWRYLRFLGCDPPQADELTQETFLAVLQRPWEERSPAETAAYLRQVARGRMLSDVRQNGRKPKTCEIEFNPAAVAAYRLIGYEDRMLAAEDFNDDAKDAGEIGAGHTVTALYEVVPAGQQISTPAIDALKYQKPSTPTEVAQSGELMTRKLRYKEPDGSASRLLEFPVRDEGTPFAAASNDTQFAAAVAAFGMLLRDSKYRGSATYDAVLEIAAEANGEDPNGHRAEFLQMVQRAKEVAAAVGE